MATPESNFFSSFDRVIITGGSSGIGAALLRRLATLIPDAAYCNLSRSEPGISDLKDRLHHVSCDLADPASVASGIEAGRSWLKETDKGGKILQINNSGFGAYGVFPAPSTPRQVDMIAVNAIGPVRLTAEWEPELKKSGGAVINIASTAAYQPTPYLSTYGATKAFLLHWSLAVSEEWRKDGVHVLAVCPGPTETAFFKAAGFEKAPLEKSSGQTADEVASITLKALDKGKTLVTCGFRNRFLAAFGSKLPMVGVTRLTAALLRKLRLEQYQKR